MITLTSRDRKKFLLNPTTILTVVPEPEPKGGSHIKTQTGDNLFVKETPEEVWDLIVEREKKS